MEEVMSKIFQGFKLVKELETSLPEKSPESLATSLDEIAKTFGDASQRLNSALNQSKQVVVFGSEQMLMHVEPGLMQEYWLRCGGSTSSQRTEGMVQTQLMAVDSGGGRNLSTGGERSGGGSSGSSTPRQRRRKDEGEEQTVLVAALRSGNIDMLPDDNHTWRKYGQKEILGSTFPRAYYRCTHQKLYNCPAKKQVQRLNDDPYTFRVTYRGSHTCHIYSTAPTTATIAPITSAAAASHPIDHGPAFLDMETIFGSSGTGANMDFIFPSSDLPPQYQYFQQPEDGEGDK